MISLNKVHYNNSLHSLLLKSHDSFFCETSREIVTV